MPGRNKMWTIDESNQSLLRGDGAPGLRTLGPEELPCVFQPLVDFEARTAIGWEAFVRCTIAGYERPVDLFTQAVAESAVGRLGRTIRESAFAACPDVPLFVNLHPHELSARWLVRTDDPITTHESQVFLEITESATLEYYDLCRSILGEVRSRTGAQLVVDDFGAGHSNLERILDLRPAIVKLDRALVSGLDRSPRKQTLASFITRMCAELDAMVVAEGVETVEELRALIDSGVRYGQGFLFGKPMPSRRPPIWPREMK